jgi:hypothetical protein
MNSVKKISKFLFYVARFLAGFYFLMVIHSGIALLTGWCLNFRENGKYFQVYFPFTKTPVLNGDNNLPYIFLEFLIPISLYGLFFLLLSNVFKLFFQSRLFTQNGIIHLRRFYLTNLIVPLIMVLLVSFIDEPEMDGIIVIVLHGTIGIFAFFLAAIFKQGLDLQNEKDLFI